VAAGARKLELLVLGAIVGFFCAWQAMTINRPFGRDAEGCGAFFGLLARNYFRYGLASGHGVPVMSMGKGVEPIVYANHPPATPLFIAGVYGLAGYRGDYVNLPPEWQARLPTALFTVGCIVLVYFLVRRRATPRAGLIAAALFASIPMTLMYGGFPDVINPQLLFFVLLTVATYERFAERPAWRRFLRLLGAFFGAAMMDWPAYYLVPVLGLHFVLTQRPRAWPWIVAFGAFSVLVFAGMYSYLALARHDWNWMGGVIERRTMASAEDTARPFTMGQWLYRSVWEFTIGRHTLVVFVLALTWIPLAVSRWFTDKADRLTGLLLAWGTLHVVVGRQGVFQHEWWWWPITPGLVIAAALTFDALLYRAERQLNRAVVNITAVVAMVFFAAWNVRAVRIERTLGANLGYTLPELGQAIRHYVPPDSAVIVADSDKSLAFWYYTDRACKRNVWSIDELKSRLNDGVVDITFDKPEAWTGPVSALVVPRPYMRWLLSPLPDYLDSHFKRTDLPKFVIYDLQLGRDTNEAPR
jgi:hypothetical protein